MEVTVGVLSVVYKEDVSFIKVYTCIYIYIYQAKVRGDLQSAFYACAKNKCLHLHLQTNTVIPLYQKCKIFSLNSFSLLLLEMKPFQKKWKNAEEMSRPTRVTTRLVFHHFTQRSVYTELGT